MNTARVHTKSFKNFSDQPLRVNLLPPKGQERAHELWLRMSVDLGYIVLDDETTEKTAANKLKETPTEHDFYTLPKVKEIKRYDILINLLISDKKCVAYKVAMLNYLGLFDTVYKNGTLENLYKKLSKSFNESARTIKGNKLVLNKNSNESKKRYRSHDYFGEVKNDYNKIKLGHAP